MINVNTTKKLDGFIGFLLVHARKIELPGCIRPANEFAILVTTLADVKVDPLSDENYSIITGYHGSHVSRFPHLKDDVLTPRSIVSIYLLIQALSTGAWWALLLLQPASLTWFKPTSFPAAALLGFGLADGVLLIAGSLVSAIGVSQNRAWASIAIWSLAATVWYPTLYCIGVSIMTGEAWLAAAMMVSMAGLTLAMATIHGIANQQPATIRVTRMTKTKATVWTVVQIVIFWSVFLWILPKGIVEIEQHLAWPGFAHEFQHAGAIILFCAAALLGLTSGITMATRGDGTPLPTATAPNLVVSGPYQFVRNPMAVAGIVQGIAIGWWLGSYSVIAYSIAGALAWHCFVRPMEEADLMRRFGQSYQRYKDSVGLWLPRF